MKRFPLGIKGFMAGVTLALALVATVSFVARGTVSNAQIPLTNLSGDPLYAAKPTDKPTMALALSVEYPTVGAQYLAGVNSTLDDTYQNTNEYLGYYDAEGCYAYNDNPTETVASGKTKSDYKRFYRTGAANQRQCSDGFSGNFLNWASNSAVDMLRLALSGGDRYIDTQDLTLLQRAVLPNDDPVCMWNSTNFPGKRLVSGGGGAKNYWGAIPQSMIKEAKGNDIWIANTLNRIYFRAAGNMAGNCDDTRAYAFMGPVVNTGSALPAFAQFCSLENGDCSFKGSKKEVWYGAGTRWAVAPAQDGVACTNEFFGDPAPGTGKACYLVNYTGTWKPGGTLNSDGFFYARVQVCDIDTSGNLLDNRDYGLCQRYPSGRYKPSGVVQKYSDQLRLAAFGYLMDQTASYNNGRYGGVLRAPMKYVGQKTFDATGREELAANSRAEWDPITGVFTQNPENDTTFGVSGVINYLNQFGRTGPTPGRYKMYDPVGELYYQALRYMQGLPPTPDAISNLGTPSKTNAFYDGYPVYTDWSAIDPYGGTRSRTDDYSCLRSNIVVIGDINTHDGNWRNIPTANDDANNVQNFRTWHQTVQAFEKNLTTTYLDGAGKARTTGNPNGANNNVPSSSQSSQIMGYAYWAHTHDIRGTGWTNAPDKQRPGLRVKTFTFDVNEYGAQNDPAVRQYRNQFFMASKYGGFEVNPGVTAANPTGNGSPYNNYGNPFINQGTGLNSNDVWQKADAQGEASTYYLQSDARRVLKAFDEIFARAGSNALSISQGAVQSRSISASSPTALYSANFNTETWSGDVVARSLSLTNGVPSLGAVTWSAADRLKFITPDNRNIFVGHQSNTSTTTFAATAFTWAGITGKPLVGWLNLPTPTSTPDNLGQKRLNYLRGVRIDEGSNGFRIRTQVLGDIINSGVTYSGPPSTSFSGNSYALFRAANDQRVPTVFAGSNDGMLHAFAAQTVAGKSVIAGDELFSYIPSWMGPKLSALTSSTYATNHQSYVDAPSTVGEAQVAFTSGAGAASDWKTVLVSGTGAGGRGVFALDVSKPESFSASNVMWEFTDSDDADMGFVVGAPQIMKFKTGVGTYRWFAVVASGVNNYNNAATSTGGSANPTLFMLALDKAINARWDLGSNYFKISLPFDSSLAAGNSTTTPPTPGIPTGITSFSALYAQGGEVTQIYAGDLHGKLWKLDFTDPDPKNQAKYKSSNLWTANGLSSFKTSGNTASPMFIAMDDSGNVQPITTAPALFTGPKVQGLQTFFVMIGTGKFLESGDISSTKQQSIYVLYDDGSTSSDGGNSGSAISGRGRLIKGSIDTTAGTVSVPSFAWGRPKSANDTTQRSGWYLDLPSSGERVFTNISPITGRLASFSTGIPGTFGTTGVCVAGESSGRQYMINIANGTGRARTSLVGMLGANIDILPDNGSKPPPFDSTGRSVRILNPTSLQLGAGGLDPGSGLSVQDTEVIGRLSWRQIYNYNDLRKKGLNP